MYGFQERIIFKPKMEIFMLIFFFAKERFRMLDLVYFVLHIDRNNLSKKRTLIFKEIGCVTDCVHQINRGTVQ